MKFSAQVWQKCLPVYQAIINHPFNQQLMHETLDIKKFSYYLEQDILYLKDYSKSLALIAARTHNLQHAKLLMNFTTNTLQSEQECVHQFFQKKEDYQPLKKQSAACLAYTSYLLQVSALAPVEVAIATNLPCPWVYWEIGKHMAQFSSIDNFFAPWVTLYSSQAFGEDVLQFITIFDEVAEYTSETTRHQMLEAFHRASILEWLFWEEAYQLKGMADFLTEFDSDERM